MPLKTGSDAKTVGFNIKELIHAGEAKGHIGTSGPKKGKDLQKQAVAIALNKAGKSNKQTKEN